MHTVFNTVLAIMTSVLAGLGGPADQPAEFPALVVVDASPAQQASLESALVAFEAAELALPPLVIEFAAAGDTAPCAGNAGLFTHATATTADTVTICHRAPIFLLHELAHAYVNENLDASAKDAYLDHLGLTEWSDQSAKWSDRANERAANTIAYTLTLDAPSKVDNINTLVCDYETLIGSTHINVANATCEATA